MGKQRAFVFIKPHACVPKNKNNLLFKERVLKELRANDIEIVSEGKISSNEIEKKKLIDAHYYAIASKATLLKPSELNVPEEKFKDAFGVSFQEALEKGSCYNALDACKALKVDGKQLERMSRESERQVKFGGGFYCAKIDDIYVFNAFFMSMRDQFVKKGKQIKWFVCEFDDSKVNWADFRNNVLGATDPSKAPETSLRGILFKEWRKYGLAKRPSTGENGVHASASPFEAIAEIANWTGVNVQDQEFGQLLIKHGIAKETLELWAKDPQVTIKSDGSKGSLFDQVEDMDAGDCMKKLMQLNKVNDMPKPTVVVAEETPKEAAAVPQTPTVVSSSSSSKNATVNNKAASKNKVLNMKLVGGFLIAAAIALSANNNNAKKKKA